MKNKEVKSLSFKLDGIDETGEFVGYASTFGNVDLGGDIVERGAFTKTLIQNNGVFPILDHHRGDKQIGFNIEAQEDKRGLKVRGKLNLNVALAKERHALMMQAKEVGWKMGLSIGYRTIQSEPDMKKPEIRRLKELKLEEYSVVTFPMNEKARVTGVKGLDEIESESLKLYLMETYQVGEKKALECVKLLNEIPAEPGEAHSADDIEPGEAHSIKSELQSLIDSFR